MPPSASPDAFAEAVAAWRKRIPVTDEELAQLTEELRPFAFTVASTTQADMVQQVYEALDTAIAQGTTFEDFKEDISNRLGDSWSEASEAPSLETVFRTNVLTAYNDGRDEIIDSAKETHEYLRFDAIHDDRTTEECLALNGTILPVDDSFWDTHRPPIHFNCRSILTPLRLEDAEKEGISDKAPDVDPDDGFGERSRDWSPDAKDYTPEIRSLLERRIDNE